MTESRDHHPSFLATEVSETRYFFLDLTPELTEDVTVVCGGCERCNASYRIQRDDFRFHSVECVVEGEGQLILRGAHYRLLPGTVFSYGPKVPHVIETSAERPLRKYFVDFLGRRAERLLAQSPLGGGHVVNVSKPNEIADLFELLLRDGNAETRYAAAICSKLIELLLLKIGELVVPYGSIQTRAWATYQRVHRLLDEHYATLASLDEAAAQCHVDSAYICRLFQRFDHVSPYQYLTRLKMNHAAEQLGTSGHTVKEVAAELNFADPYHFSHVFKKVYGVSPTHFVQLRTRP
jgi:AraC-like DNA-binding protein